MSTRAIDPAVYDQHVAVLGRTGSGKTYAAKGIVEQWLAAGRRVCVLDPTGAWWGLRSSADGNGPGFPVAVFGGDHGDVPISEHSGAALGELIAANNIPAVIDLSDTTLGARHRFVERFAESVFRANRTPLHLVIDEADEFAPQSGPPGTERMLGAIDRIVRRGRIKGFRVLMISQRPAVLNKNVLTQASTLIAMRLPAPQDRKAVEAWIMGQGDAEKGRAVLASLAGLARGEGWVWAPEHGVLTRDRFPMIRTYDSSRTPEDGAQSPPPARLADIDLSAITQALAAATQEARANDPAALRARIKELESEVRAAKASSSATTVPDAASIERYRAEGRRDARMGVRRLLNTIIVAGRDLEERSARLTSGIETMRSAIEAIATFTGSGGGTSHAAQDVPRQVPEAPVARPPGPPRPLPDPLGAPHRKILDALGWWAALGHDRPTREQVAATRFTHGQLAGEAARAWYTDTDQCGEPVVRLRIEDAFGGASEVSVRAMIITRFVADDAAHLHTRIGGCLTPACEAVTP